MTKVHTEEAFELLIEEHLLAHGYRGAHHTAYDTARALLPGELFGFIQDTQPKACSARARAENAMTDQTVHNAVKQYRKDRDPHAPIFRFKERALVHFAVDTDEVKFTTRLARDSTYFLPFNKGHNKAGGNPPVEGKHRTHYLWEEVWERHSLLDIVGRFIHLQREEKRDYNTQKMRQTETMLFPRYHQLDCVRKLVAESAARGAGKNYLVQHSTGSGKSNSIAWLAHRLSSLHDERDEKLFDSVIVVTDRRVLDQQLQDTIYQLDHKAGVVERIETDSAQLAKALEAGKAIIITTLHKFPFVTEKVGQLPDRNYAVIVDEAHSSQSGEMAADMKKVLSGAKVEQEVIEELESLGEEISEGDVYTLALKAALGRGQRSNLSFYAFTGTPKYKTLEMFGHTDEFGLPAAFHLYSMKQAIEEEFVLDVLKNCTTAFRRSRRQRSISKGAVRSPAQRKLGPVNSRSSRSSYRVWSPSSTSASVQIGEKASACSSSTR